MLDDVYNFITLFKNTQNILKNNLVVKQEKIDYSDDEQNIEMENIKVESSDDEPLIDLKEIVKQEPKTENNTKCRTPTLNKVKRHLKRKGTNTNNIASSILEGEFLWIGDTWW